MIKKIKTKKNRFSAELRKILTKEKLAFNWIKKLKAEFPKAEIYLVGGVVRDLMLKRPTKDFDFVIRNVEAKDLENFLSRHGKVNLVGKAFGVFKFIPFKWDIYNPLDVALPRSEHTFGTGGYKDVEVESRPEMTIEEDLSRRDFTINAMALRRKGEFKIIDPFKGVADLKKKIIRAVGEPRQRFKEDYSRMLRAIRFASALNFTIEKKTRLAIKNQISHLNDLEMETKMIKRGRFLEQELEERRVVPYEVIAKEFLKSLEINPLKTFDFYDEMGIWREITPEILKMKKCPQPPEFHSEGDVWQHTRLALTKLYSKEFKKQFGQAAPSLELILSIIFHDLGKPDTIKRPSKDKVKRIRFNEHDLMGAELTTKICQRLKLSSPEKIGVEIEKIAWLVRNHMILIAGDIDKMRPATIEKYFFQPKFSGQDLLKLSFVDIAATLPAKGKPVFDDFYQMLKRIKQLEKLSQGKKGLPKSLLNGHEIMEKFSLEPGPEIGQLLEKLREKQLAKEIKTKEEALAYLAKILTNEK